jgi:hypothetical protein
VEDRRATKRRQGTSRLSDLFELEAKGQFRPPALANLLSSTHSISLLLVRQEGKNHGEVCHKGVFIAEDRYEAPTGPPLKVIGVKKNLTGSRVSKGSDREIGGRQTEVHGENIVEDEKEQQKNGIGTRCRTEGSFFTVYFSNGWTF